MTAQPTGPYYSTEPDGGALESLNAGWQWLAGAATDVAGVYSSFLQAKTTQTLAKAQLAEARAKAIQPNVVTTTPPLITKNMAYAMLGVAGVMVFSGVFLIVRKK